MDIVIDRVIDAVIADIVRDLTNKLVAEAGGSVGLLQRDGLRGLYL
jgi:hypothetical protein